MSVIRLLHVSVYVGTDRPALILNSFEVKHILVSGIIIIINTCCLSVLLRGEQENCSAEIYQSSER